MLPLAGIEMTILPVWLPAAIRANASTASDEGVLGDGEHLQFPVDDVTQDLPQQSTVSLGLQTEVEVEVDHRERRAAGQGAQPQRCIGVHVLLAKFDEPAPRSQDLHTAARIASPDSELRTTSTP